MTSVWLVTVGEPLIGPLEDRSQLRTGQLALALIDAGWNVTWWTSGFDHFRKRPFTLDERRAAESVGARICWLDGVSYRRNISVTRELNHIQLALAFRRQSHGLPRPDVIAVSYPPIELASALASHASRHAIPFLIDVRDLWPDIFEWAAPAPARRLVRAATYPLRAVARRALRRADAIVGISDGYLAWGLTLAGRERRTLDRVVSIFGAPGQQARAAPAVLPPGVDPDRLLVVFAGTFGRSYDIATVVSAARRLPRETAARLQIVIAGDGERRAALEASSAGLSHVVFTGWLGRDQAADLLSSASAGLAAYAKGALQSLPNKIIDYLSFGRPIINALEGECAALISRTGAGWNYRPGDADDLARLLTNFVVDANARERAAQRARALFAAEFDPAVSLRRYRELLEELARKHRDPPWMQPGTPANARADASASHP